MKEMTTSTMRQANGGLASAKCPWCGQRFTGLFLAWKLYDSHLKSELKARGKK